MSKAYIALGSNIEPKRHFIDAAVREICLDADMNLTRRSSIYDTYPVGTFSKERFLNGVVEIETVLEPRRLLERLAHIEKSLGRIKRARNSPRTIDLDILLYDGEVIDEKGLKIPHPRMHKRDFVLLGMNEIAPETRHPLLNKSIKDICEMRQMNVIRNPARARGHIVSLKKKGRRIGFVPTMGCLHEGHLSLVKKARQENDIVVISIFVNPAQFGPGEDYKRYPRNFRRDKALARKEGVDIIFYPRVKDMYAAGHATYVDVEKMTENLCGRFRPGHFRGVATVVTKLFNIVPADNVYFGQKDAQQAFVINRMTRDLSMPVTIKILPIVREKDGLAMSSRNAYLNRKYRREATILYRSLRLARDAVKNGERSAPKIKRKMRRLIEKDSAAEIEYISIVDTENLKDLKILKGKVLIALAAYFGRTRLIDNVILKV